MYGIINYDKTIIARALDMLYNRYKDDGIENFIFINTGNGGSVYSGIAIKDKVQEFISKMEFKNTQFVVSGLVASASTLPMILFDKIFFTYGSEILIHDVSTITYGNRRIIRNDLRNLETTSASLLQLSLQIPKK